MTTTYCAQCHSCCQGKLLQWNGIHYFSVQGKLVKSQVSASVRTIKGVLTLHGQLCTAVFKVYVSIEGKFFLGKTHLSLYVESRIILNCNLQHIILQHEAIA